MPPDVKSILVDIRHAIAGIKLFTAEKSLDDFRGDLMLRRAVERQFEIIGEAMTRLRKADPRQFDLISEARGIVSFRNVLIHGYDSVRDEITWRIVQDKLPVLRQEIEELLKAS
jgi:uncharacterized protein with HEPN domain